MDDPIFPDEDVLEVRYTPRVSTGCRVTLVARAMCPTCPGLPFPLRESVQEARADADEHDRIAHGPVAGSVSTGRKVTVHNDAKEDA